MEDFSINGNDMNELNNLAPHSNLNEKINYIRITKELDNFNKDEHENNLRTSIFILQKGLMEQRENRISKIKKDFKLNIHNYEDGKCPFERQEKLYLQSKIYKMKMLSFQKDIELYNKDIFFTKKFSEVCDIILLGLRLRIPVILEGEAGQGKQTAINYMANILGLEIINIEISNSTKAEDLFLKINIEKSKTGEISFKNQETELYKAIKSYSNYPNKLIVFKGINNSSPSVLNVINSIFVPDAKIFLSNGFELKKGI